MSDNTSSSKRIAKNTLFLYGRMIITMLISLYTSRVILQTLGVDDFGIYNLVGGIAAMFQFLNGTLSDATQRYITVEIGRGEHGNVNKIFSTCLSLHFILGIIIILIAEPIGLWLIHNKLIIPTGRLVAATWVFHFSLVSLFFLIISVPYNALIIAHERMKAFAMISIIEVLGKLIIAYALLIGRMDRLILYGLLMLFIRVFMRILYTVYCRRHFLESKYKYYWDSGLIKEMTGFASWTVIGNLAFMCITQGISVLLGLFFLPAVNAARGIAVQVQYAISNFVRNFQTAVNPQITKSYASNHLDEMYSLIFRSSRFSFYLVLLPLIPIYLEADILLKLWLGTVPEYTVGMLRILLLIACMNTLSNPIGVAIKASGKIREFELYAVSIYLLVLPISYLFYRLGFSPLTAFIVYLIIEILAFVTKLYVTGKQTGFSIYQYFKNVIISIAVVTVLTIPLPIMANLFLSTSYIRLILVTLLTIICGFISIVLLGITPHEKLYFVNAIRSFFYRIKTKDDK